MRIAAMFEEELRNVIIVVVESNHHRAGAFGRRQIDIGTCTDKRLDARQATAASGVQERRETAIRVILGPRLRRNLARPVVELGASIHVRALGNQNPHHLRRIALSGSSPHQRRLILDLFNNVYLRTGINKHLENRKVAVLDGNHQRGLAV
jgi:hypothetical protein